jgi:hypothetical protein
MTDVAGTDGGGDSDTEAGMSETATDEIRSRLEALVRECRTVLGFAQAWQPLTPGDLADLRRAVDAVDATLPVAPPPDLVAVTKALEAAHELIAAYDAITDPEAHPELQARANAMLLPCDDAMHCPTVAPLPAARDTAPADVDVNAAIDALADKAKRGVRGSSGHAWGREAEVDRLAQRLKEALADADHEAENGDADCTTGAPPPAARDTAPAAYPPNAICRCETPCPGCTRGFCYRYPLAAARDTTGDTNV